MEGVRDLQLHRPQVGLLEQAQRLVHGRGGPGNDRLPEAIEVGRHHSLDGIDDGLDLVTRRQHRGHLARVVDAYAGHLPGPGTDRAHGLGEAEHARGHQGGVLAHAVAGHHVGMQAILFEHPQQGDVGRQHGRLADVGVTQGLASLGSVFTVDVGSDGTTQDGLHDDIGLAEGLGHHRLAGAQLGQHAQVLRTLSREEEGHPGRPAAPAENPLVGQGAPAREIVAGQCGQGPLAPLLSLLGVTVLDDQALGRLQRLGLEPQ